MLALSIISGIVVLGAFVGFYARSHHKMDLEQWTVGGRGFGVVLVWLLMAGEQYTTFTFLGASGGRTREVAQSYTFWHTNL